jgi:carboxymethylenebutenolidase
MRRRGGIVAEKEIIVETADGTMRTLVVHPDTGGPFPVVVVYMDAAGIRETLRNVARRVAASGYFAVLPDLYYRFGDGICFDTSKLGGDTEERQRMFATMQQLSDEMVIADTTALLAQIGDDEAASPGSKGCVGFCMGGRHVLRVVAALPEEFAAGAGLHPSFLVTDASDSPHRGVDGVRAALYLSYGDADEVAPPSTIPAVREQLDRCGVRADFDVHSGADHGFMFPGERNYQEAAAERSWERTLDLLRENLQGAAVGAG